MLVENQLYENSKKAETLELAKGAAGFLQALLYIEKEVAEVEEDADEMRSVTVVLLHRTILKTVKFMTGANNRTQVTTIQQNSNANVTVTSSRKTKAFQLKYTDKEGHLGAMYGTCGILYMLMKAV